MQPYTHAFVPVCMMMPDAPGGSGSTQQRNIINSSSTSVAKGLPVLPVTPSTAMLRKAKIDSPVVAAVTDRPVAPIPQIEGLAWCVAEVAHQLITFSGTHQQTLSWEVNWVLAVACGSAEGPGMVLA